VTPYIALDPVKARLVTQATAQPWSSAAALAARRNDVLIKVCPVLKRVGDLSEFMGQPKDSDLRRAPGRGLSVGRPLMAVTALAAVERQLCVWRMLVRRGSEPDGSRIAAPLGAAHQGQGNNAGTHPHSRGAVAGGRGRRQEAGAPQLHPPSADAGAVWRD